MSKRSERERVEAKARAFVHEKHPEWHDQGVGIVQGSHYRSGFVAGAAWQSEQTSLALESEAREEPTSGWSTEDRRAAQAEAQSRFGEWLRQEATERYGEGCVNGFTLGAEWWKARTVPEAREVTEAEVEADALRKVVPSVPHRPKRMSIDEADAHYYREAARNIRYQANRGNAFSGSNVTETVARLCDTVSDVLAAREASRD